MFEAQAQCDLLHPEREDQTVLDELKFNIGSEAFESQYQQQPVPPDGKMVKRNWFACYDPSQTSPQKSASIKAGKQLRKQIHKTIGLLEQHGSSRMDFL